MGLAAIFGVPPLAADLRASGRKTTGQPSRAGCHDRPTCASRVADIAHIGDYRPPFNRRHAMPGVSIIAKALDHAGNSAEGTLFVRRFFTVEIALEQIPDLPLLAHPLLLKCLC